MLYGSGGKGNSMKNYLFALLLVLFATPFAAADSSHASLVLVKKNPHHVKKHHAHKATRHKAPKHHHQAA